MPDVIANIAVNAAVNKTFHYLVPDELKQKLAPGSRVLVPFGSRRIPGTVVGFPDSTDMTDLKYVIGALDEGLAPGLLELCRWMADYYLHPLGQTIEAVVPKAISRSKRKTKRYLQLAAPAGGGAAARGRKQAALVRLLSEQGETAVESLAGFSSSVVKALVVAGIAKIVEREPEAGTGQLDFTPSEPPELMPEQREAVEAIGSAAAANSFHVYLLHGVTGSGKTEVYLHAIKQLCGTGKGAIVLVPEIALTPQLLSRFRRRFGCRVAVLHSGLTDRERADEYRRIQAGQVDVAIGARSAVFAPFSRVGLIVVDEEHENSYKQDEGLRYHARDVAIVRALFQKAVAVLGSATPSLESYYNAQAGKYRYLRLAKRVDHRPMPEVTIVDAKAMPREQLYSPPLLEEIRLRLEKEEQVLLLLNRRGFSSVLICRECGSAVKCPSCSVSLTFHKSEGTLKCHYCGFFTRPPDTCPSCGGIELKMVGSGTQKVEEELRSLFPAARLRRMDSDSVKGRDAYDRLLQQVDRREVDILLGTQMIAKGHDFPAVTLVGVVDADVGLNLPDFRASEKTFQLITQAAGRAGRGQSLGEVIIQTMNPNHYSMQHSRTHDYEGFYNEEIAYRTQLGYPPVGRIIKVEVKSAVEDQAREAAKTAQERIRSLMRGSEAVLLGPAAAPIARIRGQYRFHLLLLSRNREAIRHLAAGARSAVEEKFGRKCRVILDVDPVNLM
jgi:primosomal protein N' (replication factor Y)